MGSSVISRLHHREVLGKLVLVLKILLVFGLRLRSYNRQFGIRPRSQLLDDYRDPSKKPYLVKPLIGPRKPFPTDHGNLTCWNIQLLQGINGRNSV